VTVTEERVGLVILLSEAQNVSPSHPSVKERAAIEDANTRIAEYQEAAKNARWSAIGAMKSIVKVVGKIELVDTKNQNNSFQMKQGKVLWTVYDTEDTTKEVAQIKGPLAWNEETGTISGKSDKDVKRKCKLKDDDVKMMTKGKWVMHDDPVEAVEAKDSEEKLRAAVEKVSQPIGGEDSNAYKELEKLLRKDNGDRWKKVYQKGVPHLLEAYYAGQVKLVNGPGFEHLGDKELCAHVDVLVKHYLGKDPILQTAPTRCFGEAGLTEAVFGNRRSKQNVVVKRVDGRGGVGVWVGKKIENSEFQAARASVETEPDAFICQKYTTLSEVDHQIVDLRGPSFITSENVELSGGTGVAVSPILVGRGSVAKGGNGKVNISDNGFEFMVATCPDA